MAFSRVAAVRCVPSLQLSQRRSALLHRWMRWTTLSAGILRRTGSLSAQDRQSSSFNPSACRIPTPSPADMLQEVKNSYWLLKTEPHEWSWEQQSGSEGGTATWDGVRNLQAQKNMKAMQLGDLCFFYHSGSKAREVVGIVAVSRTWEPEDTSQPPASSARDGNEDESFQEPAKSLILPAAVAADKAEAETKSSKSKNKKKKAGGSSSEQAEAHQAATSKFGTVRVTAVMPLPEPVGLDAIKSEDGKTIHDFVLLRQQRLSVVPVSSSNWETICRMGGLGPEMPTVSWPSTTDNKMPSDRDVGAHSAPARPPVDLPQEEPGKAGVGGSARGKQSRKPRRKSSAQGEEITAANNLESRGGTEATEKDSNGGKSVKRARTRKSELQDGRHVPGDEKPVKRRR